MKTLAKRIRRELQRETAKIGHCIGYEQELERLRPTDDENRKEKIAHFGNVNGFKLSLQCLRKSLGDSAKWNE